jgi:SAM-dependent methyltransferase
MDRTQLAYWEARARDWRFVPPLAPCEEDVAWYEAQARNCAESREGGGLVALLLGVTPGIATMRWPDDTTLVAVDWAAGMLGNVWPRHGTPARAQPLRGDWRELPFASRSVDFVVGDNLYMTMGSVDESVRLNREVGRVLRPGGRYCQRSLGRTDRAVPAEELFENLRSGRVRHLDFFRFLLAMAVQGASREGVALDQVWRLWNQRMADAASLGDGFDWAELGLANLETWRGSVGRYCFLSQSEAIELAEPLFDVLETDKPNYEWRDHVSRLVMRRRSPKQRASRDEGLQACGERAKAFV